MTEPIKNPPAFPQPYQRCEEHMPGMDLLDYFAARAMQGAIASGRMFSTGAVAREAYLIADCMIKERQKWLNK